MHKHFPISIALIACISTAHRCFGMDKQIVVYQENKASTVERPRLPPEILNKIFNNLAIDELLLTAGVSWSWHTASNHYLQIHRILNETQDYTYERKLPFSKMFGMQQYVTINNQLMQAIQDENQEAVEAILNNGYANANYIQIHDTGATSCIPDIAVKQLNLPILKRLKKAGANLRPRAHCHIALKGLPKDSHDEESKTKYRAMSKYLAKKFDCARNEKHYRQAHIDI